MSFRTFHKLMLSFACATFIACGDDSGSSPDENTDLSSSSLDESADLSSSSLDESAELSSIASGVSSAEPASSDSEGGLSSSDTASPDTVASSADSQIDNPAISDPTDFRHERARCKFTNDTASSMFTMDCNVVFTSCSNEGGSYKWNEKPGNVTRSYYYQLVQGLLTLHNADASAYDDPRFFSDTNTTLYGTWKEAIFRTDEGMNIFEIRPDSLIWYTAGGFDSTGFNYMESEYIGLLYKYLAGNIDDIPVEPQNDSKVFLLFRNGSNFFLQEEFNPSESQNGKILEDLGIQINSITKREARISINGKDITIKVHNAFRTFYYDVSVEMEISSAEKSCSLNFDGRGISKELCKDENADKLSLDDENAYKYTDSNEAEFYECIKTL